MGWPQFRERVNLYLFQNKERTLGIFKFLNITVTLVALGTMVWMYGFHLTPRQEHLAFLIIKLSFGFYVLHYLTKVVYDFHPRQFMKRTWFEGLMMAVLLVEGASYTITGSLIIGALFESIGIRGYASLSALIIQAYFLVVVITEFVRNSDLFPRIRLNPAIIFVLSFVFIILAGTGLLMLPAMTVAGSIPLVDSMFTATSATCVTGLMTVDPNDFTFKGQFIILCLIKLGGINIIAFGGFLALVGKLGVGIRHHRVIEGFVNKNNILSAKGMLGKVILWTTSIELLGAVLIYYLWDPQVVWSSNGDKVFNSIFHAMSAFNNAGISLFTDGFYNEALRYNYLIHWILILLIFFGSLGILAIFDLFEPQNLRSRLKHPWKQINFSTKIALYVSLLLVFVGAVLFFFFERNNTLAEHSTFGKITESFFASVSPRTAGYNTVHYGLMSMPAVLLTVSLMYIGGSSSSTAGGIKTSSLAIIWADVVATMRGRPTTILFKRTINPVLKSSAYSIAIIYVLMNFTGSILLSITETQILATPGYNVMHLVFEQVSAFSTVGLSMGITSMLTEAGKYILIGSMFVGRVGTFTIVFALAGKFVHEKFKYPEGQTIVG
ncbi:MAG: potassium transporter TrkG [Flavobacteriales bacterium]|nr:potassium transporter TrkG [Flavobacteriales bacterium]